MPSMELITMATTVIIVIITGYYAIITHRMLKYQKDITALELRPFLKMESLLCELFYNPDTQELDAVQLGIRLKNTSRVILKYHINSISASIEGKTIEKPKLINYGGYVYPDQTTDFTYEAIKVFDASKTFLKAEIAYELEYFSTDKKKYKSSREYKVFIFVGEENRGFKWKSVKEEESEL